MKKSILVAAFIASFFVTRAQINIRTYVGVGYGLENQVGFRGATFQGELAFGFQEHMEGIINLNYFYSNNVPKWDKSMNEGAYYHQSSAAIKFLYYSGTDGNGFLLSGGLAFRSGKSYHFLTGDLENGKFTNNRYITDQIKSKGFVGGIGYGFKLSQTLNARIEFSHYAFTSLNDMQTLTLKIGF